MPCWHGIAGTADTRRKDNRSMDEKAKEARRAYKREWNRKNKDKVKASQERYWARKAAEAEGKERAADGPRSTETAQA